MALIRVLILIVLAVIFIQDLKSRSVYWFLFPELVGLFFGISLLRHRSFLAIFQPAWMNCSFMMIQLLLVSAYFSVRQKSLVNITNELLGWGDILLLLSAAFYLSVLNFIFFYLISLMMSLAIWLIWQVLSGKKDTKIPLAGLQAIGLVLFLMSDWYGLHFNAADDTWLLNLIHR